MHVYSAGDSCLETNKGGKNVSRDSVAMLTRTVRDDHFNKVTMSQEIPEKQHGRQREQL
jgi:hypothetical protein